jgi:Zn-dependent protease
VSALSRFFMYWRTIVVRDREIVDAVVHPEHRGPSPELRAALDAWPGARYWAEDDGEGRLILIRRLVPPPPERWWLHAALFLATFGTVWMGGAAIAGASLAVPFVADPALQSRLLLDWLADLRPGLGFAIALIAIILAHELGHYVVARRYAINTSPPYFLPCPPMFNLIGTFGAFIRLRSPIVDRRQLLDVGAAGPWAGFVVSLAVLAIGLGQSGVVAGDGAAQVLGVGTRQIYLGDSVIMFLVRELWGSDGTLMLSPIAFAGWVGLFITMLNLLPLGQLDGGHVLYALLGDRQRRVGGSIFVAMIALGLLQLRGVLPGGFVVGFFWLAWAVLVLILGHGRLAHPAVLDRHRPLPRRRRWLGWATLALFAATFTPAPFHG